MTDRRCKPAFPSEEVEILTQVRVLKNTKYLRLIKRKEKLRMDAKYREGVSSDNK